MNNFTPPSFNPDDINPHLKSKDTWLRVLFIALFAFAFYVVAVLTALTAMVQLISKLFTGKVVTDLSHFGQNLGTYMAQITAYVTFATDTKPFPFNDFPKGGVVVSVTPEVIPPKDLGQN